jgi:hypothetical protein
MGIQFNGNTDTISTNDGTLNVTPQTTFGGEVGIAGTLTYEDVTNVDSVGVITARTDINLGDSIIHIGDTNTKIRFPSNDTISFETGGGEGLRITSDGVIGINDTNPGTGKKVKVVVANNSSYQMAVNLTNNNNADINFYIKSGESLIAPSTSTPLCLGTGGAEKLRIDNAGDIFIGTSTDIAPTNGTNLCVSDATISRLILEKQSTIKFGLNVSSGFTIYDETNDAARFNINSDGQIMIGDSTVGNSTTEKLILQGQIGNNSYESSIALRRGSTIGSNDAGLGYIKFQDSAGSTGASIGGRADSGWSGSSRPTHLLFYTTPSGSTSSTEACRITSAGYLQQHKLIAVSYSDSRGISLTNVDLTPSNFYNATFFASDSTILDSNGHFVAPIHGIYRLYFRCTTDSNSGNRANVRLRKNGNTINEAYDSYGTSGHYNSVSSEIIMELNAGEYMDIQVAQLHTQGGTQHKVVNFHMLG